MVELPDEVLEIDGLAVSYPGRAGSVRVLDGVGLTIGRGEFVGLVGESGSGKTTLAATALGLLPPGARIEAGDVRLSGRSLVGASEERLSRYRGRLVGLVPQDPGASLNPVRTIEHQIREIFDLRGVRRSAGESRREIVRLLSEVEITDPAARLGQYPHELSGGIKQRILIAMAFALEPRLIIADEPTSALDVTVQRQVLDLFRRLASERGTSVLLITHDISLATDYADRIAVLQTGSIVEDQPTGDVVRAPRHPYTATLLDEAFAVPDAEDAEDAEDADRAGDAVAPGDAEPGDAEPAVRVSGLGKVYGGRGSGEVVALRDVSFEIPRGATVGLVGESGSGKSTIAKILLRLVDESQGELEVSGDRVGHLTARAKRAYWRRIQLVHQNPDSSLDPRASVAEIIGEPLAAHGIGTRRERAARVAALLADVRLSPEHLAKRPGELSGGQRQRVAIARALALNSPIVILDEPLSALDVVTQSQIIDLLQRLQREHGLSFLFISHDLSVVRRLSDRVVVLRRGRIVETGTVDDVFDRPQHEYTRTLLAAVPGRRFGDAVRASAVEGRRTA